MPSSLRREIGKKQPFASAELEAFLNLARTTAVLSCQAERLLREFGLSGATYNALRILRGHGPAGVPSQTIGEQLIASVPDVTRLVSRLVDSGLAERSRTRHDRRVVIVQITRKGQDLLARIDRPLLDLHTRQLGHMKRADLDRLSRLLTEARHPPGSNAEPTPASADAAAGG